ncbi:ABC transporter permease [Candidatus Dependentiae bacterium]|nr:ABC transporter permease [Candidatus Dependentiae bacterium]
MFKDFFQVITSYRSLLFNLAVKELKIKYKSTVLGFLWSILVPVIMAIIFKIIFSYFFAKFSVEGISYTAYLLTGLFPWIYFSGTLATSTNAFVDQANVLKKVKLPIQILPISISLSNFYLLMIDFIVLLVIYLILGVQIRWTILMVPIVYFIFFIQTTGISLLFSSLNVRFRDIKYIVEVALLALFYITPIIYPVKLVYGAMHSKMPMLFYLLKLNPLFGIITYLQDLVFYGRIIPSYAEIYSFVFSIGIFIFAQIIHNSMKKKIMDLI